jgi:TonB family protein
MAQTHTAGLSRYGMALCVLCGFALPAWSATADAGAQPSASVRGTDPSQGAAGRMLDFDIPAQPLAAALSRYALLTQQPVLYPSDMAVGRTSAGVHGRYMPEDALQRVLAGTGLAMEKTHTHAGDVFILTNMGRTSHTAADAPATDAPPVDMAALLSDRPGYAGLVQARIWQAICADASTAPGHYSTVLRFAVDTDGSIRDAQLVDSTGDARRDATLLEVVRRVRIEAPPPPAFARQSLTMAILPGSAGSGPPCRVQQGEG